MELEPKTLVAVVFLVVLWTAEGFLPFFPEFPGGLKDRIRHDTRNILVGVGNALLVALLFGGLFLLQEEWAASTGVGLLRWLDIPGWMTVLLAISLFDLWMYVWHRANHEIPFLWRFHRMHHSDPELDASTGLRFHPGELILSSLARLAILPVLGMSLWHLAVYEAILLPVILYHHSNVRFPDWLDRRLLGVIVTPAMHRVHHSRWHKETNSNYGSIFPWWDRIFRSFRLREDPATISLGLDGLSERPWQTLGGMLRTPLASEQDLEGGGGPGKGDDAARGGAERRGRQEGGNQGRSGDSGNQGDDNTRTTR